MSISMPQKGNPISVSVDNGKTATCKPQEKWILNLTQHLLGGKISNLYAAVSILIDHLHPFHLRQQTKLWILIRHPHRKE